MLNNVKQFIIGEIGDVLDGGSEITENTLTCLSVCVCVCMYIYIYVCVSEDRTYHPKARSKGINVTSPF